MGFWMCIGLVSNNSSHLIWALHKYSNKWEGFYCSFNSTQSTVYITTENRTRTWETQSWRFPNPAGSVQSLMEKWLGWVGMRWNQTLYSSLEMLLSLGSQKFVPETLKGARTFSEAPCWKIFLLFTSPILEAKLISKLHCCCMFM